MMLDDDVECETESILRAVTFGDLCRSPTLVGGHMFSIYRKTQLHSFGERVKPYSFWWGSAPGVFGNWDFAERNLRSTRWLHARVDVDYNGWFMCLIPTAVIAEIGLSLPVFIKWDDAEYGLRAKAAGYPTVSLPGRRGLARPVDRQERRAGLAVLLPRPQPLHLRAAALASTPTAAGWSRRASTTRSSTWCRCSTPPSSCATRRSRTSSPGPRCCTRCCRRCSRRSGRWSRATTTPPTSPTRPQLPEVKRHKLPRKGKEPSPVISGRAATVQALLQPLRQLRKPRELAQTHPEAEIMAQDAKWHKIGRYDSAIVTMPDQTSAAFYRRDRSRFTEPAPAHGRRSTAGSTRSGTTWPSATASALARDHLARGVGGDLPAVARSRDRG